MDTSINFDEWKQVLEEARAIMPVPDGWLNAHELAEIWRLSESHTRKNIMTLLEAGKIERKMFPVPINSGRSHRLFWHYRLLPAKKNGCSLSANGKTSQTQPKKAKAARRQVPPADG